MAKIDKRTSANGLARSQNWATIVYPESAPSDWLDILGNLKIEVLVSPLHDKDKNPTGEEKKAHYHVIIMFPSVKTEEQAKEIFDTFGGVGSERVASIRGYARYLCHLDNPEKYIYDTKQVVSFGGADYFSLITLVTDKYATLAEILDFCDDNEIFLYSQLIRYCRREKFEWFRILCDGGSFMVKEYLKTAEYEHNIALKKLQDNSKLEHNKEFMLALKKIKDEKNKTSDESEDNNVEGRQT